MKNERMKKEKTEREPKERKVVEDGATTMVVMTSTEENICEITKKMSILC